MQFSLAREAPDARIAVCVAASTRLAARRCGCCSGLGLLAAHHEVADEGGDHDDADDENHVDSWSWEKGRANARGPSWVSARARLGLKELVAEFRKGSRGTAVRTARRCPPEHADDDGMCRSAVRGSVFRASLLTFAVGPCALVAFWWLHRERYIAATPYWLLALLLVACSLSNLFAVIATANARADVRLHVRLAVAAFSTTWVVYATGWGPILLIGYAVGIADVLSQEGSKAWRPGVLWTLAAIACGELAIALNIAPSLLDVGVSHALATGGCFCLLVVVRTLGVTSEKAEVAAARLEESRTYFHDLVQHAADVIALLGADLDVRYMSPAVVALLGREPDACIGQDIRSVLGARAHDAVDALVARFSVSASAFGELYLTHEDGTERRAEAMLTRRADGSIVLNLHDVTWQRALEEQLRHRATFDALTGLPNRHAIGEQLEQLGTVRPITALFIDLDGFKDVNDRFGHERGDEVLCEIATRVAACMPAGGAVGRLGGDEFLAVLPTVDLDVAVAIARLCVEAVEQTNVGVSASIGVATAARGEAVDAILRRADEAMYCAKAVGRGNVHVSDGVGLEARP
jgi:diguanylate cyclase (GGDEF)-like protein